MNTGLQCVLSIHCPVYTRMPAETVYTLDRILKITAILHPNDPSREIWDAVEAPNEAQLCILPQCCGRCGGHTCAPLEEALIRPR